MTMAEAKDSESIPKKRSAAGGFQRSSDSIITESSSQQRPAPPVPAEEPSIPMPRWILENQALGVVLAFILITLYMLPLFILLLAMWRTVEQGQIFSKSHPLLSWFVAYINSASSTLNEFHKVLF